MVEGLEEAQRRAARDGVDQDLGEAVDGRGERFGERWVMVGTVSVPRFL